MNLNIIGYILYALLLFGIIIRVGLICYRNGSVYVFHLLPQQAELALYINKVLLAGYYLVNLGYVIYMISSWEQIKNWTTLISQIANHSASIILIIAGLHYLNIIGINLLFNKHKQF